MSHDAFLRTIADAPGDDAPRLVYADWLDERGDPASATRAEFIRLQVKAANLPDFDPRKPGLEDRAEELLAANEAAWLGDWPDGVPDWTWERGFVGAVTVRGGQLAALGDRIFAAQPVARLTVLPDPPPVGHDAPPAVAWPPFHDRPWLSRVEELDLGGDPSRWEWDRRDVPAAVVAAVLAGPHLTGLRTLRLSHPRQLGAARFRGDPTDPDGPGPDATGWDLAAHLLASAARTSLVSLDVVGHHFDLGGGRRMGRNWARFPQLREVGLSGCNFGNAVTRGLVGGPVRLRLARLGLAGTQAGRFTLDDLFSGGPLPALRDLDLGGAKLRPADLGRVLDGPGCPALRVLRFGGPWYRNEFGEPPPAPLAFPEAVAGSGFWQRATGLCLPKHGLDAGLLRPLARSSRPAGLRELDLSDNPLGPAGVDELCAASWLGRLTHLRLSGADLDREACAALAACGPLGCLRELDLGRNEGLDEKAVAALAGGPALKRLVSLDLSGVRPGVGGLEAVLNSGALPHLRELRLSVGSLGAEEVRAIARSPQLKKLRRLDFSYAWPRLSCPGLRDLAESPDLPPNLAVDLTGSLADDPTLATLRRRLRGRGRI